MSFPLSPHDLKKLRRTPPDGWNRVKAALDLSGKSQADIVRATGMVAPQVSDVVRGRYASITLENAYKFAQFFGCSVEDLFPSQREKVA